MRTVPGATSDSEFLTYDEEEKGWLQQALAVLEAINQGELLSALPEEADDRERHQTGVTLLGVLEMQIRARLQGRRQGTAH